LEIRLNVHKAIVRKDLILDLRERVICLFKAIWASAGASARASAGAAVRTSVEASAWSSAWASAGSDIVICGTCSLLHQKNIPVNIHSFINILFILRGNYTQSLGQFFC